VDNEHPDNSDDIPVSTDNEETDQTNQSPSQPEDENERQRHTIIPTIQNDSGINHNHTEKEEDEEEGEKTNNNIDDPSSLLTSSLTNDVSSIKDANTDRKFILCQSKTIYLNILDNAEYEEAQKQLDSLREHLNETNGKLEQKKMKENRFLFVLERLVSMENAYRNEEDRYRSLTSEYELIRGELVQLKQRSTKESNDNNQLLVEQQTELEKLSKSIVSKQSEHDQLLSVYLCFFLSCYLLIFFLFFCLLSW
jgi:hypothetical protein